MGLFSWKKRLIGSNHGDVPIGGPWKLLMTKQVPAYQECLNKIFVILFIETRSIEQEYTESEAKQCNRIMEEYKASDDLLFLYVQSLVELYLWADPVIRQLHKKHWVKVVTGYRDKTDLFLMVETDFFPPPANVIADVYEKYCK